MLLEEDLNYTTDQIAMQMNIKIGHIHIHVFLIIILRVIKYIRKILYLC